MGLTSYNIATSGMIASQMGLNVTGHNISNIATPGYSKQQLIQKDARYINVGVSGQIGLGTDIDEIRQMRDQFLDQNYRQQNSSLGYWDIKKRTVDDVQSILDDSQNQGLQQAMTDFWNSWQDLEKDPNNLTTRAVVRQKATVMIDTFNQVGAQLDQLQKDANKEITTTVDQINSIAQQIADLNLKIQKNEVSGDHANDYRDQRNNLLDQLSKIVDINVQEDQNGLLNVSVGGTLLVAGAQVQQMTTAPNATGSYYLSPAWQFSGQLVNISSGQMKGLLESRGEYAVGATNSPTDGSPDGVINIDEGQIIPSIKEKLNTLLNTMVTSVNNIHSKGYGIDNPPSTGINFFTTIDSTVPAQMGNVQVNPNLSNLNLIAASSVQGTGDGNNAQSISNIRNSTAFASAGGLQNFDDFYNDTISKFADKAQEAEQMDQNQQTLVSQVDNKRQSILGVNLDEEMTNMLKYQHAYEANARMLNVIDEMMQTVIEKL